METAALTAEQLDTFRSSVLEAVAGYAGSRAYSGCVRADFSLGGFVLSTEIRDGLVLAADVPANRLLLLLEDRADAERLAAQLNDALAQLCIGPNCYVEASPVRDSRETVTRHFLFTKKQVELVERWLLHVSLSW